MSALEKAIAFFSPEAAARRAYYRAMLENSTRAYDAAKASRRTDGWYAPRTGANAEIGLAADRIRSRVHDLVRNDPHAAPIPRKWASKIIGSGIQPRLKIEGDDSDTKAKRAAARDIWDRFADNCDPEGQVDIYALQFLAATGFAEGGEVLIRNIRNGSRSGKFPLQIQVLEGEYLDGLKNQPTEDGGAIIQGVQFDASGLRTGYWLFDEHPGDRTVFTTRTSLASKFVPADDVDHIFDPLRPGQARGVSMFAPVALLLRDVGDWKDAELMKKKIASCFAAFVTRNGGPAASPLSPDGKKTNSAGQQVERMTPGMVTYLQQGEDVEFGSPAQDNGEIEYLISQLQTISNAVGLPLSMATGILNQSNFAGMRVGVIDFQDLLDHMQWHVMVPRWLRRTWKRLGQVAIATNDRKASDPWKDRWIMPPRRMLDPQKEVGAIKDAVRSMQMDPFDAMGLSGYDPEEIIEAFARWNKLLDDNQIITDMDPRRVGATSTPAVVQTDNTAN